MPEIDMVRMSPVLVITGCANHTLLFVTVGNVELDVKQTIEGIDPFVTIPQIYEGEIKVQVLHKEYMELNLTIEREEFRDGFCYRTVKQKSVEEAVADWTS